MTLAGRIRPLRFRLSCGGAILKIEAHSVEPTAQIPHGIRYRLTLHEPYGTRILGYDNAHAVRAPKKFKHAGRRFAYETTSIAMPGIKAFPTSSSTPINC